MREEGVHLCTPETFEKNRLRWHHKGYCRPMFIGKYLAFGNQDSLLTTDTHAMLQDPLQEQHMRIRKAHGMASSLSTA